MSLRRALIPVLVLFAGVPSVGSSQGRPSLQKVLHRWIQGYETGALKLDELALVKGEVHPVYGRGWLQADGTLDLTHRTGLEVLLDRAAQQPDVSLTREVLGLAALGLLDGKATVQRPHHAVRHLAGLALSRFVTTDCVFFLMQVADGDLSRWKKRPEDRAGLRVAAIFALGAMGRPVVRPTLQKQLRAADPLVRLATAEALQQMRNPGALDDLAQAMRAETDPVVAQALVRSAAAILERQQETVAARLVRGVLHSAIAMLGRTDWRADLEVVELLAKVRSAIAIPPLIEILERHAAAGAVDDNAPVVGGGVSRRLLQAARDTLKSLTGAVLKGDDPKEWRAYWERVQADFVVAAPKSIEPARTVAGFFGLPVRGSDVVFIIDTSGSMRAGFFPTGDYETGPDDDGLTRLGMARRELTKAVKGLEADTRFNVVAFSTDVRPWQKGLVRASQKHRTALAARVAKMKPVGATNIFGALTQALGLKTLRYGSRYEVPVDEIFLLSDGEPTVGEVIDPGAILQLIRETNRVSSVLINTVYMGGGGGSVFMRKLAEENGGRYVQL